MSHSAYLSSTSFRTFSFPSPEERRGSLETLPQTLPLNWTTLREGLVLLALFGSLYGWFWLGWAMGPS